MQVPGCRHGLFRLAVCWPEARPARSHCSPCRGIATERDFHAPCLPEDGTGATQHLQAADQCSATKPALAETCRTPRQGQGTCRKRARTSLRSASSFRKRAVLAVSLREWTKTSTWCLPAAATTCAQPGRCQRDAAPVAHPPGGGCTEAANLGRLWHAGTITGDSRVS